MSVYKMFPKTFVGWQMWRMTSCCGSEYTEQAQARGNCQQYGVRSYLHQVERTQNEIPLVPFYHKLYDHDWPISLLSFVSFMVIQFYECTTSIWERDEDFQIQRSPSRWSSLLWKVIWNFSHISPVVIWIKLCTVIFTYKSMPFARFH